MKKLAVLGGVGLALVLWWGYPRCPDCGDRYCPVWMFGGN